MNISLNLLKKEEQGLSMKKESHVWGHLSKICVREGLKNDSIKTWIESTIAIYLWKN